jgi:preprotein translocase subunit SecE
MISKITSFIKEVRIEMKKVNWPNRQETLRYVLIVLASSAAIAVFLGLLDYILIQKIFIKII